MLERVNESSSNENKETLGICIWCDKNDNDCIFCDDPSAPMDFVG